MKMKEKNYSISLFKNVRCWKSLEAATQLEIDAVIDPADTRSII